MNTFILPDTILEKVCELVPFVPLTTLSELLQVIHKEMASQEKNEESKR